MKTKITQLQAAMIKTLTRRANRRLERASAGQRRALEYYINKETGGAGKFSAATSGLSFIEARKKIAALERFLSAKSSTRAGWEQMKKDAVKTANETLGLMGYEITDDELAIILQQIDTGDKVDYYDALDKVQAAKYKKGEEWTGSSKQIVDAIAEQISSQQALKSAIINRGGK